MQWDEYFRKRSTLFQELAGSEYSGKLDKEIALEHNIKKITYGSKHEIIWQE